MRKVLEQTFFSFVIKNALDFFGDKDKWNRCWLSNMALLVSLGSSVLSVVSFLDLHSGTINLWMHRLSPPPENVDGRCNNEWRSMVKRPGQDFTNSLGLLVIWCLHTISSKSCFYSDKQQYTKHNLYGAPEITWLVLFTCLRHVVKQEKRQQKWMSISNPWNLLQ